MAGTWAQRQLQGFVKRNPDWKKSPRLTKKYRSHYSAAQRERHENEIGSVLSGSAPIAMVDPTPWPVREIRSPRDLEIGESDWFDGVFITRTTPFVIPPRIAEPVLPARRNEVALRLIRAETVSHGPICDFMTRRGETRRLVIHRA